MDIYLIYLIIKISMWYNIALEVNLLMSWLKIFETYIQPLEKSNNEMFRDLIFIRNKGYENPNKFAKLNDKLRFNKWIYK